MGSREIPRYHHSFHVPATGDFSLTLSITICTATRHDLEPLVAQLPERGTISRFCLFAEGPQQRTQVSSKLTKRLRTTSWRGCYCARLISSAREVHGLVLADADACSKLTRLNKAKLNDVVITISSSLPTPTKASTANTAKVLNSHFIVFGPAFPFALATSPYELLVSRWW